MFGHGWTFQPVLAPLSADKRYGGSLATFQKQTFKTEGDKQTEIENRNTCSGHGKTSKHTKSWRHIPEKVGLLPCRRFLESWSWHPSVFQTISSGQQASWCLFLHVLYVWLPWESGVELFPRERWESPLGAVSCLRALWQLFLRRSRGRKLWPRVFTSLIWRPQSFVHCSTLFTASWILQAEDVVYSDALHTARSSACRVTCRGSTVVMLLMCRRKSVGEMTPPCGSPRISRFCSNGHPVLLWLICRVGSIGSICTFFQKHRSQVSSAGDLHARLCQKLLLGQRKQRLGMMVAFSIKQELCHSSTIRWRAQGVFFGSRSKVFDHVICDAIWSCCFLTLQLFYCCFNLFHGDGLAHAVVWQGCFSSCVSCSLTWQVLSLGSLTLLSSWYSLARQLAASFWTIGSPSDCRTVCAFSGISPFSSLVSFHNLPVSFSMLKTFCHAKQHVSVGASVW